MTRRTCLIVIGCLALLVGFVLLLRYLNAQDAKATAGKLREFEKATGVERVQCHEWLGLHCSGMLKGNPVAYVCGPSGCNWEWPRQ